MAMFKCKMCGGNLEVSNETVAVCEYCNTKQTLPKTNDDVMSNLFNRANNLRLKCEFDKAIQIYEKILEQDDSESEAHWGIVLCKYGIEYVEDPETSARIPTCHRTLFEAVTTDSDYLAAIDYSDATQQSVYESEARAIDRIQKDILKIVENEKPFDVFICYKETDENGKRTVDSTIANDIYYQLTEEGFKVFYSAITLEDKLGEAYEPYIFAALNSAKVMLVLGTKPEYFNAVWVKNEWSRYLQLMKTNRSKLLIPCYRDMDAYDLPEEFSHLQSQDMSKIGFINDVIRGIKKVIQKNETKPETVVKETVVQQIQGNTDTVPLLKRAFMFLEDGDFKSAEEYCEKVLDINPECAEAYLGKLMVDSKIGRKENLKNLDNPFSDNINYQKIMRFGDENLKNELSGYIEEINQRNENARIARIYNDAVGMMRMNTESSYERAIKNFESIYGYKDSIELAEKCREAIAQLCEKQERERIEREAWVRTKKLLAKKIAVIAGIVIIGIVILNIINTNIIVPYNNNLKIYNQAISYMDAGQYEEAMQKFEEVGLDFKDSQDKYEEAKLKIYNQSIELMDSGRFVEAMWEFEKIGFDYKDSQTKYDEVKRYYQKNNRKTISAGNFYTVGLKSDGTVIAVGDNEYGQCTVSDWTDIVAVSAGDEYTVGLKSDGTVVSTCYYVSDWTDIVSISSSSSHTVGLKSDGTVVATGYNDLGQCYVLDWTDIIAVSAGYEHTIGLKSDGTVVAVGRNRDGQCNVSGWTDIVAIATGNSHTVGLKSDGTVVATGDNYYGQCDVSDWTDIVTISAGGGHTVGLKSNGTVVATGSNSNGQCDVSGWRNIVAVSAGNSHTIGLKSDGTVVATGNNYYGQCDVSDWTDIKVY